MIRLMLFGGALALCCLLPVSDAHAVQTSTQPPVAQTAAIDTAVIALALAAATDEAREALVTAHPEIADEPLRRAIGEAATKKGAAGDTVSAFNGHRTVLYACTRAGNARGRVVSLNLIGTLAGQTGDFAVAESALSRGACRRGGDRRYRDVSSARSTTSASSSACRAR